ncbi:MAG TPA: hypothetical protein VJY33_23250, partial [Isosphaeraceae bacterium]|nr:hypothetical protein [Isosphaeraceae bacterium]
RESPRPVFHRGGHVTERLTTIAARLRLFRQNRVRPPAEQHGDQPTAGKPGDQPRVEQPGDPRSGLLVRAVPVPARTNRLRAWPA